MTFLSGFEKTAISLGWVDKLKTQGLAQRSGITSPFQKAVYVAKRRRQLLSALKKANPSATTGSLENALKGDARHFSGNKELDKEFTTAVRTNLKGYRAHKTDTGFNRQTLKKQTAPTQVVGGRRLTMAEALDLYRSR